MGELSRIRTIQTIRYKRYDDRLHCIGLSHRSAAAFVPTPCVWTNRQQASEAGLIIIRTSLLSIYLNSSHLLEYGVTLADRFEFSRIDSTIQRYIRGLFLLYCKGNELGGSPIRTIRSLFLVASFLLITLSFQ